MIHTEVEGEELYKTQTHIIFIIIIIPCMYECVCVCDSPECVLFAHCFSLNLLQRRASHPLSCCPQKTNLNNCSELTGIMRKSIKTFSEIVQGGSDFIIKFRKKQILCLGPFILVVLKLSLSHLIFITIISSPSYSKDHY